MEYHALLHKASACYGVQVSACPWYPVAPSSLGPLAYLGPGKGSGSLPLA